MRSSLAVVAMMIAWPASASANTEDDLLNCAPMTVSDAVSCLDRHLDPKVSAEFLAMPHENLIRTNFGLGLWIRNNWVRHGKLNMPGAESMDDISGEVLEAYWLKSHACHLDWNDRKAVDAAGEAAARGQACGAAQ